MVWRFPPGGVDLGEASCVAALIKIGDPAAPRLLEVLENDRRLTRSVHYWRNFHPSRTVLAVSEAALTAVMSILRSEFYSPGGTGSNFTSTDDHPLTHPWCIDLLEAVLVDTRPSGFSLSVEFDGKEEKWKVIEKEPNSTGGARDGSAYVDETVYDRKGELRYCDLAVPVLLRLLGDHAEGRFQPLSGKRDETISELRHYLKVHHGRFRNFADDLGGGTGWAVEGGRFLPVLPQRTGAATRADVAGGLALFALDHPGQLPAITMPVATYWLARKPHFDSEDPNETVDRQVVALQVERDSAGDLWFGVADGNGFFVAPAREIGSLWPLSDEVLGTGTR